MADTVLESLEQEISSAFREFAVRPTQSARITLRHRLLTAAGALDVEAYNLPQEQAAPLIAAIADLRTLAEAVLIAPKESLITQADLTVPIPEPEPAVQEVNVPRWGIYLAVKVMSDFLGFFRRL
jgi:hypothetical protein